MVLVVLTSVIEPIQGGHRVIIKLHRLQPKQPEDNMVVLIRSSFNVGLQGESGENAECERAPGSLKYSYYACLPSSTGLWLETA